MYLKSQIYHIEVLPPLNPKSMDLPHLHPYHVSSLYLKRTVIKVVENMVSIVRHLGFKP